MEIRNSWVPVTFILLLIVLGFTLYNINNFMVKEKKCESSFEIIDKCGCIPSENMAKLFNTKYTGMDINYTLVRNQE